MSRPLGPDAEVAPPAPAEKKPAPADSQGAARGTTSTSDWRLALVYFGLAAVQSSWFNAACWVLCGLAYLYRDRLLLAQGRHPELSVLQHDGLDRAQRFVDARGLRAITEEVSPTLPGELGRLQSRQGCAPAVAILAGSLAGVALSLSFPAPFGIAFAFLGPVAGIALGIMAAERLQARPARGGPLLDRKHELQPVLAAARWLDAGEGPRLHVVVALRSTTGAWGRPLEGFLRGTEGEVQAGQGAWFVEEPPFLTPKEHTRFYWSAWALEDPDLSGDTLEAEAWWTCDGQEVGRHRFQVTPAQGSLPHP